MTKQEFIQNINPVFLEGVCHRGIHDNKEVTENSLHAFQACVEHHMALELDVHITKDNKLVVFHDSELKRVTGKEGILEEKTLQELKEEYCLLDGEKIPTFQEVLNLVQERIPMVVELKVYQRNYKPLAQKTEEELKSIQNKKNVILISFDPRALFPFKNSGFMRQLLVTNDKKHNYVYHFRHHFEGVDLDYTYLDMKKVQRYQKDHMVNAWTIETEEVFEQYYDRFDMVTFQYLDPEKVKARMKKKWHLQ